MGFDFAKYDSGGGAYLNAADKKAIAEAGIPFDVTAVKDGEYDGEPRYVLHVNVPNPETGDPEERLLAFPIGSGVESRDKMLAALQAHLDEGNDPVKAKLEKIGRAYIIREG